MFFVLSLHRQSSNFTYWVCPGNPALGFSVSFKALKTRYHSSASILDNIDAEVNRNLVILIKKHLFKKVIKILNTFQKLLLFFLLYLFIFMDSSCKIISLVVIFIGNSTDIGKAEITLSRAMFFPHRGHLIKRPFQIFSLLIIFFIVLPKTSTYLNKYWVM